MEESELKTNLFQRSEFEFSPDGNLFYLSVHRQSKVLKQFYSVYSKSRKDYKTQRTYNIYDYKISLDQRFRLGIYPIFLKITIVLISEIIFRLLCFKGKTNR